jgi:hypothetical protein
MIMINMGTRYMIMINMGMNGGDRLVFILDILICSSNCLFASDFHVVGWGAMYIHLQH